MLPILAPVLQNATKEPRIFVGNNSKLYVYIPVAHNATANFPHRNRDIVNQGIAEKHYNFKTCSQVEFCFRIESLKF